METRNRARSRCWVSVAAAASDACGDVRAKPDGGTWSYTFVAYVIDYAKAWK